MVLIIEIHYKKKTYHSGINQEGVYYIQFSVIVMILLLGLFVVTKLI